MSSSLSEMEQQNQTERDGQATGSAPTFDPVLLAVLSNRLEGIVSEMTNTLLRTGRSAVLNTAKDFSCTIVTADCELLTATEGLPAHTGGTRLLVESMDRLQPDHREGDAFLHNDPYNGNTHSADHTILVPVFHENEHLFTVCAKAHQADCGNSKPTTYMADARDVYEEGALTFPCVRVQQDYRDIDDVIRMTRARIRVPDQWYGDYLAMLGSARVGERALKALAERYGAATLKAFVREWLDYSERRVAKAISSMPESTLVGAGCHDPVPGLPDGIPLTVKLSIRPSVPEIVVDLRDNIDCVPAGFNLSEATATTAAVVGVFNEILNDIPLNDGAFRCVRVLLREGCVAGIPAFPASCSVATTNVADRVANITQHTLAELGEGAGLAEGSVGLGPSIGVISGTDSRRGDAPYINQMYLGNCGGPATPTEDGWVTYTAPSAAGLGYRDSVEILEQKYPVLVQQSELKVDYEAAGRFRGGPTLETVYGPRDRPVTVVYLVDGHAHPPRGARGGADAPPRVAYVREASGERRDIPQVGQVVLQPGEFMVDVAVGGGGYGDPLERDPERVLRDATMGLITVGRAREAYGVVLEEGAAGELVVDHDRTASLRTERSGAGPVA